MHTPQVGQYIEPIISDPASAGDLVAQVLLVAGIRRLAVDAVVALPPLASVAINDAGAGTTEASVKVDGVAIGVAEGSLLVGARDPLGAQEALKVDASGNLLVSGVIAGNTQIQAVETTTPLAGSATFTGATRDCLNFESFGISVFITRLAANTNIDVIVENSSDGGVTFREVDRVNLAVTPANPSRALNRVYSVTRQHYLAKLVNNTANALSVTELVTMRKPV